VLGVVTQVAGFFGGALAGWGIGCLLFLGLAAGRDAGAGVWLLGPGYACVMVTGALCCFGGAALGRHLGYALFVRNVSARCSQCGGRTYFHAENARAVRYRCRSCGHAYVGKSWEE
jgi:hypothetical protein